MVVVVVVVVTIASSIITTVSVSASLPLTLMSLPSLISNVISVATWNPSGAVSS